MKTINDVVDIVNKIQKQLKKTKVSPKTQSMIDYQATNTYVSFKLLYDMIYVDEASNCFFNSKEIIFPDVLNVRELAEQHYKEEDEKEYYDGDWQMNNEG